MNNKQNEVQKHIEEKFQKFATSHGLSLIGNPGLCEVKIFTSDKKTQHTAVQAIGYASDSHNKKRVEGWIINVADKKLQFFANTEAHCLAVSSGKVTAGKKRKKAVMAAKDDAGISFQSLG